MALEHKHFITPEEYLEIDRASQDVKYEYIDGHHQADGNIWLYQQFRPGQEVSLVGVGLKFSLAALYNLTSVPVEEKETE